MVVDEQSSGESLSLSGSFPGLDTSLSLLSILSLFLPAAPPRSSRYESDRYDRGRSERYDRYSDRGYDRYDDRYDRRRRSPDYGYSRRERSPYDRDRGYYRR
jgi:hypothetical protein